MECLSRAPNQRGPCCSTPTAEGVCSRHPGAAILKRGGGYDAFAEVVGLGGEVVPIYAPEVAGLVISTTGCAMASRCVATVLTLTGADAPDGDYEVTIVVEEPWVGPAPATVGLAHADVRGRHSGNAPAMACVSRVTRRQWKSTPDEPLSRATLVGDTGWAMALARGSLPQPR